jgi:hypothetical protein
MTGLTAGTTYYVRAYATNTSGTVYGGEVSFTAITENINLALSSTVTASSIYNNTYHQNKAKDERYGVWNEYEWASKGEMTPWIDFKWSQAHTINKVVLYGRCNPMDYITDSWMYLKKNGIIVKAIHTATFPRGCSAKEVIFDPQEVDEIYFDITGGCGFNVGLSEVQIFYDPTIETEINMVSATNVTASSYYSDAYNPNKAKDGRYGVWDEYEWASKGEMTPWIRFRWDIAQRMNKVVLYDRNNPVDHINDAWIYFNLNGQRIKSIHAGMFPYGGSAKEVIFDEIYADEVTVVVTYGQGQNVGLSEFKAYYDPDVIQDINNLATDCTVTASSYYNNNYRPELAIDNKFGMWDEAEWASKGEMTPWIRFRWNIAQRMNKLVLYDRCNPEDHINDAWIYFNLNGQRIKSIHAGMFPYGGSAKEVIFDEIYADEVTVVVMEGKGLNVGLSEIQVFEE